METTHWDEALSFIRTRHFGHLAAAADVRTPDAATAGSAFLLLVRDAFVEAAEHTDSTSTLEDDAQELADGCVPIYHAEVWDIFGDLAAWVVQDEVEEYEPANLTAGASIALYLVAERIIAQLTEELHDAEVEDLDAEFVERIEEASR